jgi:RNA methyltransferase, TrmH family
MPPLITSLQNPLVKEAAALRDKKHRKASQQFLAEGAEYLQMAIDAGHLPRRIFFKGSQPPKAKDADVIEVNEAVLAKITGRDNPPSCLGLFDMRWHEMSDIKSGHWLVLDGLKDPGNMGTLLRSLDAFGGEGVLLLGETVDFYGPEVVRASTGPIFRVKKAKATATDFIKWKKSWRHPIVGASLLAKKNLQNFPPVANALILLGAEQNGLSAEIEATATDLIKIPMRKGVDSLNVAIAGGIMLYEITKST